MSLLHAALHKVGPDGLPVDVLVVNGEQAAKARDPASAVSTMDGSPSFCVGEAGPFPEAPRRLSGRVYWSVDGRLRGLPDRQALVDRLHYIAQGG